ncbi:MAG: hypothetical protein ABFR05_03825 [Bacteroidota bacterium]
MQNKLEKDLRKLAQDILLLKNFENVEILREKAQEIYEQLVVLSFQNKNTEAIPVKEDLDLSNPEISAMPSETSDPVLESKTTAQEVENDQQDIEEKEEEETMFFKPVFDSVKEDFSQKQEFKGTVSLDETEKLFKTKKSETKAKKKSHKKEELNPKQLSLHDKLLSNSIQIGLNDRIAFVNSLFNFSQSEFNQTLSFLNKCETKHQAISYIHKTIKPRYNWQGKEDLEERFLVIIERKFL